MLNAILHKSAHLTIKIKIAVRRNPIKTRNNIRYPDRNSKIYDIATDLLREIRYSNCRAYNFLRISANRYHVCVHFQLKLYRNYLPLFIFSLIITSGNHEIYLLIYCINRCEFRSFIEPIKENLKYGWNNKLLWKLFSN